ncbi:MAG: S41 family peptidase [Gemmatimonadetes bacterium]|nr:S41 family peptidase [Gemmatimonadota bacterium]MBI3504639.1 S41 family peptidase [Pseudomonadota bacterium]
MKFRSRKVALILAVVGVPLIVGAFAIQERAAQQGERLFSQVLAIVNDKFVDSVEVGMLYEKAARGLVAELKDPYADLYSPKQLEAFNQNTGGFYAGVGMSIEKQDDQIIVAKVFPHTPADEAGIRIGDHIVAVDSQSTRGWKIDQVSSKLKGTPGTKVSARFARPGTNETFGVQFTRRVVHIPAVPYAMMLDNKTAYVPVTQFNETVSEEVATNLQRLVKEGAKSIVLDLRGNPGGYLEQALVMSNLFLPKGKEIVSVRGRGQPDETHVTESDPLVPDLPIVILTDGYTASASEIVAGALQDHDRALIVGTTSFGKGLVQSMYRLDGGYAMKLTTAKWYTPSGRSIQKERKLLDDGTLVETHPDSLETDSVRKSRPKYKSDAGRVVYGGGAITPDVIVPYDTIPTTEQKLARALLSKQQDTYLALYDYSFELSKTVKPDYVITPAMREEFYQRLVKRGVTIDHKEWDAGIRYVDRALDAKISSLAFGDSTAKRRDLAEDRQLIKALEFLRKGTTTKSLLALAANTAAAPAKKPNQ